MMGIEENSTICSDFVEFDPTRRYFRYNEILGKGASKIVYRAFDEYAGIEVAWNQVKLNDFIQSPDDLERIYSEIHLLDTLKHKNIMKFYTYWVDISKRNINFITELFTSGTLRQYRQKYRRVNIRAVKQWCQQILKGLLYLHSHDPPIIHRDLKCDNIFINGNQGVVKIGDLGLAAILRKSHADHIVGTPEFMAPEVYEEQYNELVDIYSFGMCLLEMVTLEYPYSECTNSAQIYKKVVKGIKPEALFKVEDPEVRQFVEKCLATAARRLPARELLRDPFLQIDDQDMDPWEGERLANDLLHEINTENGWDYSGLETSHILRQPLNSQVHSHGSLLTTRFADDLPHEITGDGGWDYNGADFRMQGIDLFSNEGDEPLETVDITINGMKREDGSIFLRLRVADEAGHVRNIYFPFDIDNDTALDVAAEMVGELDINGYGVTRIAEMIESEVSLLVSIDASSCGSLLDSVSIDTSGCTSLQSTLYSNGEFEERCQAEGSGNGAPVHSTSISEELNLSSDTSRDGHSDEGGDPVYGSTNNWKETHVESKRKTGVRECVDQLHSSSIKNQSLETTKSRFQTKHQVGQKDERSLKLGGKTQNPSVASDHLESRAMNEAAVSLAHTSSKASSEKHRKSPHFGKFSFLNPPRRNLLQSSKSLAASDTRSHLSSGARRDQHCEASPKNSQENKFTAMKLYAGYRGNRLQSGLL